MSQLLSRMPGIAWSCRLDPRTGKADWMYLDAKSAEFFDVPVDELRADSTALNRNIVPEDLQRLQEVFMQSMMTRAPMFLWSGRIARRNGEIFWVETQTKVDFEEDGNVMLYAQAIDVTWRKQVEEALARSEEARKAADDLNRTVLDTLPVGVMVMNPAGEVLVFNPAQEKMAGRLEGYADDDGPRAVALKADGVTIYPPEEMPLIRVMHGEDSSESEMVLRNPQLKGDTRTLMSARAIRDASGKFVAGLQVTQNITQQHALETELRTRNEQLAASEEAKTLLIDRLRYSIDELSNPILEVWDDVLVMPIIGVVDSRRTADMVQRLLAEVTRAQASFVIIDLTGVEIVDTKTADHLMKLMRKVEVVGARCVLTGIRAAVAETLVDIGVDFGRITTLRNLKHGLREALRHARREREGSRGNDLDLDLDLDLDQPEQPAQHQRRG